LKIAHPSASNESVKLRSPLRILAVALCVLALLAAQTVGVRLYLCQCAGQPVLTQARHCHGPHGAHCHAPGQEAAEAHPEAGQGSCENHLAVNGTLAWRAAETVPTLVAPTILIAILPLLETLLAAPEVEAAARAWAVGEGPPPFGVAVARTIVLRI